MTLQPIYYTSSSFVLMLTFNIDYPLVSRKPNNASVMNPPVIINKYIIGEQKSKEFIFLLGWIYLL